MRPRGFFTLQGFRGFQGFRKTLQALVGMAMSILPARFNPKLTVP
jgi:hypothetical protein